jgi:hypothetical protein
MIRAGEKGEIGVRREAHLKREKNDVGHGG